jgi:parallel beta-helix repeat protein
MFDGFVLSGPGTSNEYYSMGVLVGIPGAGLGPHHFWLLNSTISNFGEAGVQVGGSDFVYMIHNTIYDNTSYTCGGAQGSGISFIFNYQPPGYSPTTDDQSGAAPYFGFRTWVVGSSFFHTVTAFNVIHNNNSQCGAESDHNGIIYDITSGSGNANGSYDYPQLAYGNVIYNNAGGGVHVFAADNVTVANNSVFNNGILSGYGMAQIDDDASTTTFPNSYYNNIAVSCTSAAAGVNTNGDENNAAMFLAPLSGTDIALSNITLMASNLSNCLWPYFNHYGANNGEWVSVRDGAPDSSNKLSTNPDWVSVSFSSPGTQLAPPASTNFALSATSPAIGAGTVLPWMPPTATDVGACPSQLTTCP